MTKEIRFTREEWRLFFFCLFIGVFVYFARIVNELPNPDAIWQGMAYKEGWGWEVGLGRYLIGFFQEARRNVVATEFISLTCVLLLVAVCVCVIKIFDIADFFSAVVVSAIIMLAPTVGSTLSYYYCSDMYFLSYLLAVGAVMFAVKCRSWLGWGFYALGLCASAAIYQAYLGVAISLCFLYLLFLILDKSKTVKHIAMEATRLLTGGGAGVLIYLISNRVVQRLCGIEAVADRGFSSMGNISLGRLPKLISSAYDGFFEYFLEGTMINNFCGGRRAINILFGVCALAVLLIVLVRSNVQIYRKWLFALGILLLPIPIMSIVIMAPDVSIYNETGVLMLPTMNYVYVAFLVLFLKQKDLLGVKIQQAVKWVLMGCCGLICYMLVVLELSGQSYMKHYMNKTQAVAYAMVNQIEQTVDNSESYRLCIIGTMEEGNYPEIYEALRYSVHWTTAYHKTIWTSFQGRQSGWISYISHYAGKKYNSCSASDYERILQSEEYATMQNFPDESGVAVIDDIIIIKLSDA